MIDVPSVVVIAAYAVSGVVLLHTVVHSAKQPPHGTDPTFWEATIRRWRRKKWRKA